MRIQLANVNFKNSLSPTGFGHQGYTYKTYLEDLKEGDFVVVETANGPTIARFDCYVQEKPNHIEIKHIVNKLDFEKHERIKALLEDDDFENLLG